MARRKKTSSRKPPPPPACPPRRWTDRVVSGGITLLVMATMAYAVIHIAVRSDGVRSMLEQKLAEQTGIEIRLGSLRAAWDLGLEAREVAVPAPESEYGMASRAAAVSWRARRGWPAWPWWGTDPQVRIESPVMELCQDEAGRWVPGSLADRLAPVLGAVHVTLGTLPSDAVPDGIEHSAGDASDTDLGAGKALSFSIGGGLLRWRDATGSVLGEITGLEIVWRPLEVPGRAAWYGKIEADRVSWGDASVRDLHLEWLQVGDERVLLSLAMHP